MNLDSCRSAFDEGEIEDSEPREFDDGLDENLMGDEEDRNRLAQMTEKEREQELSSRGEKRASAKIRFDIERKLRFKAKQRDQERRQNTRISETTEESTFVRPDSIKSNSLLRLSDILCQNILLHPFIALRRTCQVNRKCSPIICIQPFSLIPFLYHQQRKQGLPALYKGLSSELLVKGITLGAETAIANYTDWPREVGTSKRYLEDSLKVFALRGMSIALTTPFICSSVIETVQSVIVVRDRPSFIDCLKDGFHRLLHLRSTPSIRMIPIWMLVVPTVFYHLSHSVLFYVAKRGLEIVRSNFLTNARPRRRVRTTRKYRAGTSKLSSTLDNTKWQPEDLTLNYDPNETTSRTDNIEIDSEKISTSIMASLIADIALLPVETVLNSLYIQGTRTIIDNCDETTVVLPVLTNYDGFADCYQSILRFEGNMGLYKGLGAIILQYSVHFLVFRALYYLLREFQSKSDSSGPAPHIKTAPPPTMRQPNNVEDLFARLDSNRHSTPNTNPLTRNRFGETEYGSEATPKKFSRI